MTRQNTVPAPSEAGGLTTLSWSHTVNAGSNLLLVVGVSIDGSPAEFPSGITYNGVAMTRVTDQAAPTYGHASAFQLVNPSTGANTVEVTFATAQHFAADSISFSGVDQTTPVANVTQAGPTAASATLNITTASGDYAFAVIGINLNHAADLSVTAGTEEWETENFDNGADAATAGGATRTATGSTTTIAWSWTGAESTAYIGFAVQQTASDIEQEGFRFRNDDGNETTATWIAAQDTNISQATATNTRLRVLINAPTDPASIQYQLEYKKSTDTTYKKVEAPSGSVDFGTAGAAASGTTSLSVAYPASISAGDMLVLAVGNKYPNNGPTTPAGWTLPSNCQGSGGQGASGADAGSTYATVYIKEADGTEAGNLAVTIGSGNASMGAMMRYTKGPGKSWSYACTNGADNAGGATSWSVTGASDPGIITGDMVIAASAPNTDAYTYSSEAMSATGITWGAANERIDSATSSGQDMALVVSDHVVTSGTSSAAPVFTMTASGSAANRPAGGGAILRIRQIDQPIQLSASGNITASGDNTTAQLTAPAGKTTADFVTGRMQDDENPADAVDITNGDYSELEWSIIATSAAIGGDIYTFRVTSSGSALGTYTVTPQWTIPSTASSANASSSFITFD